MNSRVLHLICPGPLLGAERSVLSSIAALRERGLDVSLLVMVERRCSVHGERYHEMAAKNGTPVRIVEVGRRLDLSAFARLSREMNSHRPELVHAHGYKALFYLAGLRGAKIGTGAPLIYSYHGTTSHTLMVQLYEALEIGLMRQADLVFAVSRATSDKLRGRGIGDHKLVVVPNMLSRPISPDISDASKGGCLRLLFVGRLSAEKGLGTLLNALHDVDGIENMHLSVMGDGPLRPSLEQQSEKLGLRDHVRFEGYVEDVWGKVGDFDALVMPSLTEGMPMALIEAEAAGLPIVATQVGGIPEMLSDSQSALMVEPENPGALACSIVNLRDHLGVYRKSARERAPRIARRYSPSGWAEHAALHYQRLIGEERRSLRAEEM